MPIKHIFESAVTDGADPDLVGPDEWNDDHEIVAPILAAEIASPSTPGSGVSGIYPKSDGRWYSKGDDGVEHGPFDVAGKSATISGGTESSAGGFDYCDFTTSGTLTVITDGVVRFLFVGGGGPSGGYYSGGGGSGGEVFECVLFLVAGSYTVTIGTGGTAGASSAGETATGATGLSTTLVGGGIRVVAQSGAPGGGVSNAGGSNDNVPRSRAGPHGGGGGARNAFPGGVSLSGGFTGGASRTGSSSGTGAGGGGAGAGGNGANGSTSDVGGAGGSGADHSAEFGGFNSGFFGAGGGGGAAKGGAGGNGGSGGGGHGGVDNINTGRTSPTANTGSGAGGGGNDGTTGSAGEAGATGRLIAKVQA